MMDRVTGWRIASVLGLGVALAGCAAGGGWVAGAFALIAVAGVALSGCSSSHTVGRDSGEEVDAGDTIDGHWERCCVEGRVDTCFCEAGWSCNYGWFDDCGDGTCVDRTWTDEVCPGDGGVDAGPPDAGGTFEPCCVGGHIDTCFCPAGVACNYGWFDDCGDGTCVDPGSMCPVPDAGAPDAGGHWDACCVDGAITTCHCPAGAICNYWFDDCGDGTCVSAPDACPP